MIGEDGLNARQRIHQSIVAITARKKHSQRWREGAASVVTAVVIDALITGCYYKRKMSAGRDLKAASADVWIDAAPDRIADGRYFLRAPDDAVDVALLSAAVTATHARLRGEERATLEGDHDIHLDRRQTDAHIMGDILQIVAEAAAYRETEQLAPVKPQAHPAGFAVGAIDDNRVTFCPAHHRLRVWNAAKLHRHCGHGRRPPLGRGNIC
jgi:hypothetical protein